MKTAKKPDRWRFSLAKTLIAIYLVLMAMSAWYYQWEIQNVDLVLELLHEDLREGGLAIALAIYAFVVMVHLLILWGANRLSTRGARRIGVLISCFVLVPAGIGAIEALVEQPLDAPDLIIPFILLVVLTQGIRSFSISGPFPVLLPLAFYYAFPLFLFAGYFYAALLLAPLLVPTHRRAAEMWRPPTLPPIRRRRSGFTLIEMLIVIAIVAIHTGGLLILSGAVHAGLERQSRRRAAMEYVRDELALLRGADRPLVPGVYPPSADALKRHPFVADGSVELRPDPRPGLIEAQFSIYLRDERGEERFGYVVLLAVSDERSLTP